MVLDLRHVIPSAEFSSGRAPTTTGGGLAPQCPPRGDAHGWWLWKRPIIHDDVQKTKLLLNLKTRCNVGHRTTVFFFILNWMLAAVTTQTYKYCYVHSMAENKASDGTKLSFFGWNRALYDLRRACHLIMLHIYRNSATFLLQKQTNA